MVLLAAAVYIKTGKALVSRQFVEMTKARIEGLLAAFPKLLKTGNQHTFVETDSVRYVYQPIDQLYMVLITTITSNILEDLETLRLFVKVIPEYCRNFEESEVIDNAFLLIFAFDEITALGYRESVNLAQVRTFVDMESHEEKVYQAVRETQEREARNKMKEKAKELQRKRYEDTKKGSKASSYSTGSSTSFGGGSSSYSSIDPIAEPSTIIQEIRASVGKPPGSNHAMKLSSRSKDVDSFVDQLKAEGVKVVAAENVSSSISVTSLPKIDMLPIHISLSEDVNVKAGRDGGLQNMEIQGLLKLRTSDVEHGFIKIQIDNKETRPIQLQTHPNVDRELWRSCAQIGMKMGNKPFPPETDVGVLKWRIQTTEDSYVPLSINCWPQENGSGSCDVNIEYNLEVPELELGDVRIVIPMAAGMPPPIINECEGDHEYDRSHSTLVWSIPVIDSEAPSASMDFTARGLPENFFPVKVHFTSKKPYCHIKVSAVTNTKDGTPVNFSSETQMRTGCYEIV